MKEPQMGFVPPSGFNEDEEMQKLKKYNQEQDEKGWRDEDPMSEKDPYFDVEGEMEHNLEAQNQEKYYGSPEKIARLKELKDLIDLEKVPRVYCSSTEHDRALPYGMYFLVSDELAQIKDNIDHIESSGTGTKIILKDKTSPAIPDDCIIVRDSVSEYDEPNGKKLIQSEDDYMNIDRAKVYFFIGEDEERLRYFSKEKEPRSWSF